jgi:transposase-like protein
MTKFNVTKEEIIAEYLAGGISFRKLGEKYNLPVSTISGWVQTYQGRKVNWRERMRRKKVKEQQLELPQLPEDVKQLQTSLRKAELYSKLLEEIIRLSEEHTGIDLRKKFGTKQS